ncbi:MAG: hypothetical protein K2J55_03095, partial [Eubacterium sp.]|nr:hypothetical protein [Eubacterium sp.]
MNFNNAGNMMDMNYLLHDVGISGTRNKNIDKYEFLKDATVYMPGYSGNETNNGGSYAYNNYGGSNGYLKDYDVNITYNQQVTTYAPTLTANKLDELPVSEIYYTVGDTTYKRNRDWFNFVLKYRNRSEDWQNVDVHEDVVIWSESRLHLQTAWLAASSQFIGDADYLASTEYISKLDAEHERSTRYNNAYSYSKLANDDTITTLEYDQYFTSRLGAYNYGDWDLTSGIEFYYVMPQGVEPKLDENEEIDFSDLKAYIMTGGNSYAPEYTPIDSDLINYEVVQTPKDSSIKYRTPQIMQDPLLSNSLMNKTGHNYAGKDSYYDTDTRTSWVIRITVAEPLKKWFNRGSEKGYMMYVDVPAHVYATSESEYWYDEVMVRPLDCADNKLDNVTENDSLYYQVYDITTLWGNNNLVLSEMANNRQSSQYGGMDYLWNSYFYPGYNYSGYDGPIGNLRFVNGSPNMPYINGMNISNREVSAQGVLGDSGKDNFADGKHLTFASTGSRAHMRKPLIRTWTTVGKDNIDGHDTSSYYVDAQGANSTMNIHVENKYWLNTLCRDYSYTYYRVHHKYATDGGNKGTLYYPVVSDILPAGIVPKDINGDLFTKDNEKNATKELAWTLYGADYTNDVLGNMEILDDEKAIYTAKVEYIEVECDDPFAENGRYMVTFYQEDTDVRVPNDKKAKISSESARVFSFDFFTANGPDDLTKDFDTNPDLLDQFQSNSTFVSSNLDNFKFILDSEVTNASSHNPYYVGNTRVTNYGGTGVTDLRRDISYNIYSNASNSLPNIPVAETNSLRYRNDYAIDATEDRGNFRYYKDGSKLMLKANFSNSSSELNFEDYYDIREDVRINEDDIYKLDVGNNTISDGVYTSNRIRVLHPSVENQTFVSFDAASDLINLGKRSPKGLDGIYEYYPDKETHVDYFDNLYYNVKINNPASKTDYYNRGNIAHGIMNVTVVLPSVLSYVGNYYTDGSRLDDSLYIIYQDGNGNVSKMMSFSELEDNGYTVNILSDSRDADGNEVLVFEIITAGDFTDPDVIPTYSDYVHGKHLPGYFGADDTLILGIKTLVTNNYFPPSSVLTGEDYWDEAFKADSYVTFDDLSGSYLESFDEINDEDETFDGESFADNLTYLDDARITYTRPTEDNRHDDIDWDGDTDYNDAYAQDISAVITVKKPHSIVRLDTSVNRVEVINPDLFGNVKRAVDDPTIKGSSRTAVYLDQVVNDGGAVRSFYVDYRVPIRGTVEGTREEAPLTADWIPNKLYAVGTGKWEIPESAGDEEYREALKEKLRVKVYALFTENPERVESGYAPSDTTYEGYVDNNSKANWINLTELYNKEVLGKNLDSVSIDENCIIDISSLMEDLSESVYQLRYVIESEDIDYVVPPGFRLAIDAD